MATADAVVKVTPARVIQVVDGSTLPNIGVTILQSDGKTPVDLSTSGWVKIAYYAQNNTTPLWTCKVDTTNTVTSSPGGGGTGSTLATPASGGPATFVVDGTVLKWNAGGVYQYSVQVQWQDKNSRIDQWNRKINVQVLPQVK